MSTDMFRFEVDNPMHPDLLRNLEEQAVARSRAARAAASEHVDADCPTRSCYDGKSILDIRPKHMTAEAIDIILWNCGRFFEERLIVMSQSCATAFVKLQAADATTRRRQIDPRAVESFIRRHKNSDVIIQMGIDRDGFARKMGFAAAMWMLYQEKNCAGGDPSNESRASKTERLLHELMHIFRDTSMMALCTTVLCVQEYRDQLHPLYTPYDSERRNFSRGNENQGARALLQKKQAREEMEYLVYFIDLMRPQSLTAEGFATLPRVLKSGLLLENVPRRDAELRAKEKQLLKEHQERQKCSAHSKLQKKPHSANKKTGDDSRKAGMSFLDEWHTQKRANRFSK